MRLDHLLSMENWSKPKRRRHRRERLKSSTFVVQFSVTEGNRRCESITHIVGAVNAQGPPVPIPNTEVKLCSAEDTSRETARENRSAPTPRKGKTLNGGVAQLGEHLPCKQGVMGSNPIISTRPETVDGRTMNENTPNCTWAHSSAG